MLSDLLHERQIRTHLHASALRDAIEQLVDFALATHCLHGVSREGLVRSVLEREASMSTCVGSGLAVPHGELPPGASMIGVMGLYPEGVRCETPDDRPLRCIVLLATPPSERDRHLLVLGALARKIRSDGLRRALYAANSPAEAHRVLHGDVHGCAMNGS